MNQPKPLTFSKGFNLPLTDSELANFGFLKLTNGAQTLTAVKSDFEGGNGGTTSLNASGVNLFHTDSNSNQGTVSVKTGLGLQYYTTPNSNTQTQVSTTSNGGSGALKVVTSASSNNKTLENTISNWGVAQWAIVAGVIGAAVLAFVFLRK